MHLSTKLLVPVLALAIVLGLIAASGSSAAGVDAYGATPGAEHLIDHPTGPDDLVLRIEVGGGLLPPAAVLGELPVFSLYGDGRVVTPGPVPEIYPGPALPNLRVTRLSEEGVQAILRAARDAGLLDGNRQYENNRVMDAPTTVFTVAAEGRTTRVEVYALGIAEDDMPAGERATRAELARFQERLGNLSGWLPPDAILERDAPYAVERLQIVSRPDGPDPILGTTPEPSLVPNPKAWPLATPLADLGEPFPLSELSPDARCAVVEGTEAERLLAELERANQLTPWESEGALFTLYPRPLLPDETGCSTGESPSTPTP